LLVWRKLVDEAIMHPELIREQVMNRRQELQAQGDGYDSEISRAKRELSDIEAGRDRLMNQLAKGVITENDFERVMVERNREKAFWQEECSRLGSLRNDAQKLESDLEHAYRILAAYGEKLEWLDISKGELKKRSPDERIEILTERKRIVQSLCERITVYGDGRIDIDGLIDTGNCLTDCVNRESRL
jgi:chromosome segregation ATPase